MKVLVTGSSGQLGSYVCELLMGEHEVSGLDLVEPTHNDLKPISVKGDIRKVTEVRKAVKGVEAVVHCAAQVSVEKSIQDPMTDAQTNVLGTINVLNECARAGVARFVYISSAAVYGNPRFIPISEEHPTDPMSNYGASKLAGEKFALAYACTTPMQVTVVRPFNFYSKRADPSSPYSGVITKFVARVKDGKPPVIEGDGLQTRDFIHAIDVAEFVRKVLVKEGVSGQVFNCGSGSSTSILDLAKTTIVAAGKEIAPEFGPPRKGDIRHSLAEVTKAWTLVGFSPRISLRDGIAELLK